MVGVFWSGQLKRSASSIQLIVRNAVIGEGKLLIPLDVQIRRPDSEGRGRKCKEQPELITKMVRDLRTRCIAKGINTKGWFIVIDSWYCSNELLEGISKCGFVASLEGKSNYVFFLGDERFLYWQKRSVGGIATSGI